MSSFKAKIEKKEETYAYVLGVQAFRDGKSMQGPYERGSSTDQDWVDGYLDAMFLRSL